MKAFKSIIPILSVLFLFHSTAFADGNWWRKLSDSQKAMYIIGFYEGKSLGSRTAFWSFGCKGSLPEINCESDRHKWPEKNVECSEVLITGQLNFDEKYWLFIYDKEKIKIGLDNFFSYFENRNISVGDGVWVVLMMLSGEPDNNVNILVNNLRKDVIKSQEMRQKIEREK